MKTIRARAPLRLGIAGGGTDIPSFCDKHTGYVLNVTLALYNTTTIQERSDKKIVFKANDINQSFEHEVGKPVDIGGDLILHKAVYKFIVDTFPAKIPKHGFNIVTYSEAPVGSGLGSSSAMVVSMLKAFDEFLALSMGEYDLAHSAYIIERQMLDMKGGGQDQYAAAFGGVNFMEFYDQGKVIVNPLRVKRWILSEIEQSLVLFYTGSSRVSSKIIESQSKHMEKNHKQTLDSMFQIKEEAVIMKEAWLTGNIREIANSLHRSWEAKKKTSTNISNSKLDKIYSDMMALGAYGGKVSGAGGGGFMFFLVPLEEKMKFVRFLDQKGTVFTSGFSSEGAYSWTV